MYTSLTIEYEQIRIPVSTNFPSICVCDAGMKTQYPMLETEKLKVESCCCVLENFFNAN